MTNMAKAETLMEHNAAEALKLIAASADVALQKVALAQSLVKPTNGLCTKDHDDLTKLIKSVDDFHEEMRRILADWRKDYQAQLDDHEKRLLTLEFANTKQ